jgi:hypothetical protein
MKLSTSFDHVTIISFITRIYIAVTLRRLAEKYSTRKLQIGLFAVKVWLLTLAIL